MNKSQLKTLLKHIILEIKSNELGGNMPPENDFIPTGETRRTAIWNYWQGKCKKCGNIEWVAAGNGPFKCSKCSNKSVKEMIANKDCPPDVMGAVNVEETLSVGDMLDKGFGAKFEPGTKLSTNITFLSDIPVGSNFKLGTGKLDNVIFQKIGDTKIKDLKSNKIAHIGSDLRVTPVNDVQGEQTGTGSVAGFSPPMGKKKKVKEDNSEKLKQLKTKRKELSRRFKNARGEGDSRNTHLAQRELDYEIEKLERGEVKESNFVSKLKQKLKEKTNPDGTYSDDMEDAIRMKKAEGLNELGGPPTNMGFVKGALRQSNGNVAQAIEFLDKMSVLTHKKGERQLSADYSRAASFLEKNPKYTLSEMTTSSAAGGQAGGTISVPAWGTKNKEGSPKAIQATKKMKGWKVAKSISTEGK